MLVDVVQLRREGQKLSPEEVRCAESVRGELRLTDHGITGDRRPRQRLALLLRPGTSDYALPPLDHAWVKAINARGTLITGRQEVRRGRQYDEYPQAWWCRTPGAALHPERRQTPCLEEVL